MSSVFKKYSNTVFFVILAYACASCFWGNFLITLSSILLATYWVFDGNYKEKLATISENSTAGFFILIPFLIIGRMIIQLPNEIAVSYIIKYLPLFIFSFVIASKKPLSQQQFHTLLIVFVISIFINSLYCFANFIIVHNDIEDFREISPRISYIRLALFVLCAIVVCAYYLFYNAYDICKKERIFLWVAMVWLLCFVMMMKCFTAYVVLGILICLFVIQRIWKSKKKMGAIIGVSILAIGVCLVVIILYSEARYFLQPDEVEISKLEVISEKGNPYQHSITTQVENGHQVGIYICQKELEECWKNRTGGSVWEVDHNQNVYYYTLCRYLASKNLRKDAKAFETLTDEDIEAIKNGFTNYRFLSNSNPIKRVYEIFWEIYHYSKGGNPNGHSITQRAEFVSCAWKAMKNNPLIGAGCNIKTEMDLVYAQSVNQLSENHKCFPHNEYMFIGVLCGFAGLLLFIIALIGIIVSSKNIRTPLTIAWFIIVIVSFFTEDTLDTAAGQSLFGLFGAVILFCQPRKTDVI